MLLNDVRDRHERFAYLVSLSTERYTMKHHWSVLGFMGIVALIVFLLILKLA